MKNSKLFTLVTHLPGKEIKTYSLALAQHKRGSLKKLLDELSAHTQTEPDAEQVYKAVFGKKYTKANDYLLRNEYRLLYDWLQLQIQLQHSNSHTGITAFMQYLLQVGAHDLFEDEYTANWKKAVSDDDIDTLVQLCDLNIQYYLTAKPQTLANAEMLTELSQQRLNLLQRQFLRNIRKEEIRLKLSERIISAYRAYEKPAETINVVNLQQLEHDDLYAQYLSRRARVNFARGTEKINLLLQILNEKEIIEKYEPAADEAICRFLINLAQEYYLGLDFSNAVKYYAQAYTLFGKMPAAIQETLAMNYIMSLIRYEDFKLAGKLAAENAELMLGSRVLGSRAPFLLAVVNLYARKAEAAEQYVKLDSKKEGSEFYYFMRLVLSAVYYLRGDTDLALREAINLDQAVNYELQRDKTIQTSISKPIISSFRKYYTVVQSARAGIKADLQKLRVELGQSIVSNTDQSPNSMLTQWLLQELDLKIKSTR